MEIVPKRKPHPAADPYNWSGTRYRLEVERLLYIEQDIQAVYRLAYLHSTHPKDRAQEAAA